MRGGEEETSRGEDESEGRGRGEEGIRIGKEVT